MYALAVLIFCYAPKLSDAADTALRLAALEASAARLAENAAWSCLVSELVTIGRDS